MRIITFLCICINFIPEIHLLTYSDSYLYEGWKPYKDIKLVKYFNEHLDFNSAKRLCSQHGATLLTIRSRQEHTFIENMIPKSLEGAVVWLGLTKNPNQTWSWIDNSTLSFEAWSSDPESNNHSTNILNFCSVMSIDLDQDKAGEWSSSPCEVVRQVICERRQIPKKVLCPEKCVCWKDPYLLNLHLHCKGLKQLPRLNFSNFHESANGLLLHADDNAIRSLSGINNLTNNKVAYIELRLDNNLIQKLSSKWIHKNFSKIRHISLRNNEINELPVEFLEAISSNNFDMLQLHLGGNPYNCSCKNVGKFRTWVAHNYRRINDLKNMFCFNKAWEPPIIFNEFLCPKQFSFLARNLPRILVGATACFAVLSFVVISVCFYYKWTIKQKDNEFQKLRARVAMSDCHEPEGIYNREAIYNEIVRNR